MGRFETDWLATEANLAALSDLSGAWIDRVHQRRPPDGIILDMDSSESPTHGQQEGSAWNGHFGMAGSYWKRYVSQHFLLSAKARTLSLASVARMSEDEARAT